MTFRPTKVFSKYGNGQQLLAHQTTATAGRVDRDRQATEALDSVALMQPFVHELKVDIHGRWMQNFGINDLYNAVKT